MLYLETENLIIRPFQPNDVLFLFDLLNSEKWIRYIGNRNIETYDDAMEYMKKFEPKEGGLGAYVVVREHDGVAMGMVSVFQRPNLDFPDIGFAFLPQFEGQGYAYESTRAVMDWLRRNEHQTFQAITLPENERSIRLLARLGFQKIKEFSMEADADLLLLMQTNWKNVPPPVSQCQKSKKRLAHTRIIFFFRKTTKNIFDFDKKRTFASVFEN